MIAIEQLSPGTRIRLIDGAVAEIRENPRDGIWVLARKVSLTGETADTDDLVHVDEVAEVVS